MAITVTRIQARGWLGETRLASRLLNSAVAGRVGLHALVVGAAHRCVAAVVHNEKRRDVLLRLAGWVLLRVLEHVEEALQVDKHTRMHVSGPGWTCPGRRIHAHKPHSEAACAARRVPGTALVDTAASTQADEARYMLSPTAAPTRWLIMNFWVVGTIMESMPHLRHAVPYTCAAIATNNIFNSMKLGRTEHIRGCKALAILLLLCAFDLPGPTTHLVVVDEPHLPCLLQEDVLLVPVALAEQQVEDGALHQLRLVHLVVHEVH